MTTSSCSCTPYLVLFVIFSVLLLIRRVSEYQERYNELDNCSASVEAACSNFTIPEDVSSLDFDFRFTVSDPKWDELVDCHKNLTNSPHLANSTSKIKALVQGEITGT